MFEQTYTGFRDRPRSVWASPSWWRREWVRDVREVAAHRYVLWNLISMQLKVRYQRSALGFLWTLLNPLLMLTVMAVMLSQIVRMGMKDYAVFLFSAMVPWALFSSGVETGTRALIAQEHLIRKVRVPLLVFPLSDIGVAAVNMLFATFALMILLMFVGAQVRPTLVLLPVGVLLLGGFTLGVTLVTMTLNTFFRDVEHITGVVLQALYFLTPIMYPLTLLEDYLWVAMANPLTHFMAIFRGALYDGVWPTQVNWMVTIGCSLGSLVVGYVTYKVHEHRYIFHL